MLFRVISQPNSGPTPMGITFTQYSTCFSHNIQKRPHGARARAVPNARPRRYVDNGWRDEGFESPVEKECVDWINTKPDCSLEVVLKHNPDLAEKLKHGKPTNWALKKDWERQQDQRRGKFI